MSDSVRSHRGSPPGSSAPGVLQARILEWVAISFSNACMHACMLSHFSCVNSVQPCGQQPTRLLHPQDTPGENSGVGCHLLQSFTHQSELASPNKENSQMGTNAKAGIQPRVWLGNVGTGTF